MNGLTTWLKKDVGNLFNLVTQLQQFNNDGNELISDKTYPISNPSA